jgi:hypothetical protein
MKVPSREEKEGNLPSLGYYKSDSRFCNSFSQPAGYEIYLPFTLKVYGGIFEKIYKFSRSSLTKHIYVLKPLFK